MSKEPLLPLRDQLALDRTALANRRTGLASARTALALFVSGISFVQIFEAPWVLTVGWGLAALSVPVAGFGSLRYHQERNRLGRLAEEALARQAREEMTP